MGSFIAIVGVILLSTFLGSTIAWAIARGVLGVIEQGAVRAPIPVESPTTLASRRGSRVPRGRA